jgi:ubiquinone/menaquinone biosynthesis C-methylase UbiE
MSFDLLAPHYRWMEAVLAGEKLQRCRIHWLDHVRHCRRALLVGEGNGRFLEVCAERLPETQFTIVDASAKMLREAELRWKRAGGDHRATFVHATLPGLKMTQSFDLVVTNCFFDCFDSQQLPEVIEDIAKFATDDATWLVTDFSVPHSGWPKWRAKAVLRLAYAFFQLTTKITAKEICPPDAVLRNSGFELAQRIEADAGLIYSAMWQRAKSPNPSTRTAARLRDNMNTTCALPTKGAVLRA